MNAALLSLIRLRALLAKEFLLLLRDPRMRFFMIVPPIVQLIVFGYAATFDVRAARVAVVDESGTAASRELLGSVTAGGHFDLHYFPAIAEAAAAMDRNQVRAIARFAPDFDRRPEIQLIADGSDTNSALIIIGQLNQNLRKSIEIRQGSSLPVMLEERAWYNSNLDDRDFFVPGVIANIVLISTMILTAMTVVRERELGTLERLMVTPVGRLEFILAKMLPVACVGLFDVLLVTLVAVFWFDVPFRGDPFALLLGSVLFLMSTLGLGLLISTFSSTQQQAMLLAFFVIMPAVILSGFAFPINNMPRDVQWLTWLDPLRFYLVVIRDVFLRGGGIATHGLEYAMMALLGIIALSLSALRLR